MTIYLTKLGEVSLYPPVLSLIRVLRDLGHNVVYIGAYRDRVQKEFLIKGGVKFIDTVDYLPEHKPISKLWRLIKYKKQVKEALLSSKASPDDILWIFNSDSICILSNLVRKYRTVLHFFEFTESKFNPKYLLVNFGRGFKRVLKDSKVVVQCEYNRAQIFKGLYNLDYLPIVLPNKPYLRETDFESVPIDVSESISKITDFVTNKKVILYQGYFNSEQRRLEEFCMAITQLPQEYVLVIMGRGNSHFERLKARFSSHRILFVPFIRPPYHLLITRLARIGILSYFPTGRSFTEVVNPLYCAPNKIFEYGKYAVPMISNDIPGLSIIFKEYNCGICVDYPMTPDKIKDAIMYLDSLFDLYSQGARKYYESIQIDDIVQNIITKCSSSRFTK